MQTAINRAEMYGAIGQRPPKVVHVPATQNTSVGVVPQSVVPQQYVPPYASVNAVGHVVLANDAPSDKSKTTTLLLCVFFGYFGVHCFYARRPGRGILFLFTYGLFFFGWIWDIVMIACGKFKDGNGHYITS